MQKALESVPWDEDAFLNRGGLYDWTNQACTLVNDRNGCKELGT